MFPSYFPLYEIKWIGVFIYILLIMYFSLLIGMHIFLKNNEENEKEVSCQTERLKSSPTLDATGWRVSSAECLFGLNPVKIKGAFGCVYKVIQLCCNVVNISNK